MRRLRQLGFQVATGVGFLLATGAVVPAQDQAAPNLLAPTPVLRNAQDDDPALPQLGVPALAPNLIRTRRPATRRPLYGNPAASGAGKTGFDSTNGPARAALSLSTRPATGSGTAANGAGSPDVTGGIPPATPDAPPPRKKRAVTPTTNTAYVPRPGPPVEAALVDATPSPPIGPTFLTNPPLVVAPAIRHPVAPEEDPFAPTGVHVGSFFFLPAVEAVGGYDSNASRVPGGPGSAFTTIAPELLVKSDWSRHELTASLRGSYTAYDRDPALDRPQLDARVDGRIDVTRNTQINLEGRTIVSTDYAGSPDLTVGYARLPIYTDVGTTLGVAHRFNRVEVSLKGTYDRFDYQNTPLIGGGSSSNADRNYDQYGAIARVSYELTPGIKPFIEGTFDQRDHDLLIDRFGLERDSQGYSGKAGSTLEFTRSLTGELAIGYLTRTYRDPALPDLNGLTVDGSLLWAASGLTTVKVTAASRADESTLAGVSGVLRHDVGAQVDHAFRRWLIGTLRFGYGVDEYKGSTRVDDRYLAAFALTYKLSREWQLRGELRREWLHSNTAGVDYTANVALLGLRWQR